MKYITNYIVEKLRIGKDLYIPKNAQDYFTGTDNIYVGTFDKLLKDLSKNRYKLTNEIKDFLSEHLNKNRDIIYSFDENVKLKDNIAEEQNKIRPSYISNPSAGVWSFELSKNNMVFIHGWFGKSTLKYLAIIQDLN